MTDNNKSLPIIVSIIPDLLGGQGHVYDYHLAVGKSLKLIGCQHLAVVKPDPMIKNLPENWTPCFTGDNLEWELPTIFKIFKLKSIFDWSCQLTQYLRKKNIKNSDYVVIFLERFIISHLLGLILTLLVIPKNNLSVWLLYRRDIHNQKNRLVYKLINYLIIKILPPNRLKILSDSETLAKSLSEYFGQSVNIMPIPHTEVNSVQTVTNLSHKILCFWVGSPREEKGLNIIKYLSSSIDKNANQICLLAAKSSQLCPVSGGISVKLIADNLTRIEYLQWLNSCDICLLPYHSMAYKERTSGIFVECIVAGKIPLVTSNTWMAKELSQYQLEELIIEEWKSSNFVFDKIVKMVNNSEVKCKLIQMQKRYQSFHSLVGYAEHIKKIL